jgi:hypothetical protein
MLSINEVFVGYLMITSIFICALLYSKKINTIKNSQLVLYSALCILFFPVGWFLCIKTLIGNALKETYNKA